MTKARSALIDALMTAQPAANKSQNRVDQLFGDQPDVLDAIRKARRDRKLTFSQIAKLLSKDGNPITAGSVSGWLAKQGID